MISDLKLMDYDIDVIESAYRIYPPNKGTIFSGDTFREKTDHLDFVGAWSYLARSIFEKVNRYGHDIRYKVYADYVANTLSGWGKEIYNGSNIPPLVLTICQLDDLVMIFSQLSMALSSLNMCAKRFENIYREIIFLRYGEKVDRFLAEFNASFSVFLEVGDSAGDNTFREKVSSLIQGHYELNTILKYNLDGTKHYSNLLLYQNDNTAIASMVGTLYFAIKMINLGYLDYETIRPALNNYKPVMSGIQVA